MILLYVLFALTVSMVLTAVFSRQAAQHRQGHTFIFIFVLLFLMAGMCDLWLVPSIASGQRSLVYPVVLLVVFCAILTASVLLAVSLPRVAAHAAGHRDAGRDAESAAFGSLIWLATLIFGIAALKAAAL